MSYKARILIIDDDKNIRESLKIVLEYEGYSVDEAENGKEAMEKCNSNFYNIAIIDCRLPDIEGTKLLEALKETIPPMVKIMLTGYPSMDNAIEALSKNADAFFQKPVNFEKFLHRISELLKKQENAEAFSENQMVNFIETRIKKIVPIEKVNL